MPISNKPVQLWETGSQGADDLDCGDGLQCVSSISPSRQRLLQLDWTAILDGFIGLLAAQGQTGRFTRDECSRAGVIRISIVPCLVKVCQFLADTKTSSSVLRQDAGRGRCSDTAKGQKYGSTDHLRERTVIHPPRLTLTALADKGQLKPGSRPHLPVSSQLEKSVCTLMLVSKTFHSQMKIDFKKYHDVKVFGEEILKSIPRGDDDGFLLTTCRLPLPERACDAVSEAISFDSEF
ncbi:unnamed protein product [Protopolystoma xenopodis]|uniref:Uncharacterized protein n=1 Tax=Protopolystoma xenopodis TaxID=117903 RepID=A0A3S5CSW3_9PLAT|nr:unnamed protein product [Protopolystoma xenopodis]